MALLIACDPSVPLTTDCDLVITMLRAKAFTLSISSTLQSDPSASIRKGEL